MKKELSFGVRGENGMRAATWKLTVTEKETGECEIYLFHGNLKEVHTSFHNSEQCHHVFSSNYWRGKNMPNQKRYMHKWNYPEELSAKLTLLHRIFIPYASISIPLNNELQEGVVWISPQDKQVTQISILITEKDAKVSNWPGAKSMGTKLLTVINFANKKLFVVYNFLDNIKVDLPESAKLRYAFTDLNEISPTDHIRGLFIADDCHGKLILDLVLSVEKSEKSICFKPII